MKALGVGIGLKTVCIVGGIDMFQQVTNGSSGLVVVLLPRRSALVKTYGGLVYGVKLAGVLIRCCCYF